MSDPTRRRQTVLILCLAVYAALSGSGGALVLSWLRTNPDPVWDLKRLFYDVMPPSPNRYDPANPDLPPGEENRSPQSSGFPLGWCGTCPSDGGSRALFRPGG